MKPTILIFLKAPVAGQVKTRLAKEVGDEAALKIYQRLVQRQMNALPEGWPVEVHFTPASAEPAMKRWLGVQAHLNYLPQVERGLGERLAHATTGAFDRGAAAVMLIGGDCPALGEVEFRRGAEFLLSSDVVVGPTVDGGYYLLGMKRPDLALFDDVPWSTAGVAPRTREIIRKQGWTWEELPQLSDVDTKADWATLNHLL